MILPRFVYQWPEAWKQLWSERAAIMEIEGGMTREKAMIEAEHDIRKVAQTSDLLAGK